MYSVVLEKQYCKQLKKLSSQKNFDLVALQKVIYLLEHDKQLPEKYKDHQLKGGLVRFRECHVKHDMLLVYIKNKKELVLILVAIGTHSALFGN